MFDGMSRGERGHGPDRRERGGGQSTSSQCGDGEGCSMWSFSRLVLRGRFLKSEMVESFEMR